MSLPFEVYDKEFLLQIKKMRQRVILGNNGNPFQSVLITPVDSGHGASTVTANLAYALSRSEGGKVLLVDGNNAGLTKETDIEKSLQTPLADNLYAVKVLWTDSSKQGEVFKNRLEDIRKDFAFILIDAPPAIMAPEVLGLVSEVDIVLLLLEAGTTKWQVLDKLKEMFEEAKPKNLKVVLNKKAHYIPKRLYRWM